MASVQTWVDRYWRSADGLTLHYRDYPGDPAKLPVLCIPGVTRNARDFAAVAERLAGGRRVIVIELRGRGLSHYSGDPATYNAKVYLADVQALLDEAMLDRVIVFGTSLGGIVAMLMGCAAPDRMAGVLLNDIAPIVEERGMDLIRGYIGSDVRYASWEEAARATAATHAAAFPSYDAAEWDAFARRLCCQDATGTIVPDYDLSIATLFARPTRAPADPWAVIKGLDSILGLLIHAELSDLLRREVAEEMVRRLPEMTLVTLAGVGHPPTLDEPAARNAVDALLKRIDTRALT